MKKDIEWLKSAIQQNLDFYNDNDEEWQMAKVRAYAKSLDLINQLDEPEVLSQKWISENVEYAYFDMLDGSRRLSSATAIIKPEKLQNLLVPKQEEVDRAYKDGYEEGRELGFYKGYREGLGNKGGEPEVLSQELPVIPKFVADWIEDLKSKKINLLEHIYGFSHDEDINNYIREQDNALMRAWLDGYEVEEEQRYYLKIGNLYLAEPLGDMTSDIVRMTRDKGIAYQFTDEKSIATHLDKFEGTEAVKVEEVKE